MRALHAMALLAACAPERALELPSFEQGPPGVVALFARAERERPDGARGVVVGGDGPSTLDEGAALEVAFTYRASLGALAWRRGPIAHDAAFSSRMRAPDAVWRREGEAWVEEPLDGYAMLPALRFDWAEDRCGGAEACFDARGLCAPCMPVAPTPPEPPAPWPAAACREGMITATATVFDEPISSCTARRASCPAQARATLDGGCAPLVTACATDADGWAPAPPAGAVFVRAGASGGDGSRTRPSSLDEAIASTEDGAILWLSSGEHALSRGALARAGRWVGACPGATTVRGGVLTASAALELDRISLRFDRLTVAGPVRLEASAATVSGELRVLGGALELEGSKLTGELLVMDRGALGVARSELAFPRVLAAASSMDFEGSWSHGAIQATSASSLRARDAAFSAEAGVEVLRVLGSTLAIERVAVLGGVGGVVLANGARGVLQTVHAEAQVARAVVVVEPGTRATIRALRVRDASAALVVDNGATVDAEQLAASDLPGAARGAYQGRGGGARPYARVRELRISGAEHLIATSGADLGIERARLEGARSNGVQALALNGVEATELALSDVSLRDVRGAVAIDLRGNLGFLTRARLARVAVEDVEGVGVLLGRAQLDVTLEDLSIRGVRAHRPPMPDTCEGRLLRLCEGSGVVARTDEPGRVVARVERVLVEDASFAGFALGAVEVSVRDGRVRGSPVGVVTPSTVDWRDRLRQVALEADALARIEDL